MTKISIWCRHVGDSIIGIGPNIPWSIPSDMKRFKHLTTGNTLVVGKNTYESFPNRTLPNRKLLVVYPDLDYEVSDKENHKVINNLEQLKDYEDDLYVVGGASIYKAFYTTEGLKPEIAVDCVYQGDLPTNLSGDPVSVSACIEVLEKEYTPLPQTFTLDNIITTVWLKKNAFVSQEAVKKILNYLETEGK